MRGIITGIAVLCYAAAFVIAAAALSLPVGKPTAKSPRGMPAAAQAPPPPPASGSTKANDTKKAASTPAPPPVAATAPEELALLQLAQKFQQVGDLKKAEAIYLRLLRKGNHRDTAAQRLGDLYSKAGDYRRAEEMYRESARVVRARNNPVPVGR